MKKSLQEIVRRTCGRGTSRSADGLLLNYGASGDSVLIRGDSYPDVLHFADGTTIATSQLFTVQNGGLGYAVAGSAAGERARWRTCAAIINNSKAANDETAQAWRDAA